MLLKNFHLCFYTFQCPWDEKNLDFLCSNIVSSPVNLEISGGRKKMRVPPILELETPGTFEFMTCPGTCN